MTTNVIYQRQDLIGRWYRKTESSQESTAEYAELYDDGQFEFYFLSSEKDEQPKQIIEVGYWGLVADVHFTITLAEVEDSKEYQADMTHSDNYHAYRVLKLNNQEFSYQHLITGETFTLTKIIEAQGTC